MASRRPILAAFAAAPAAAALSRAAHADAPNGSAADRITPASQIAIEPSDTPERIIAKAANIVPEPRQLDWQHREIIAFTHYGMNTFTNREWGSGAEDETTFARPHAPGRTRAASLCTAPVPGPALAEPPHPVIGGRMRCRRGGARACPHLSVRTASAARPCRRRSHHPSPHR